ncbi:MAG: PD-(D/E)XK nuclease family protein [bacterium]
MSHHKISDYNSCPLKYKYIHIYKMPLNNNSAMVYGNVMHKIIYEYYLKKKSKTPISQENLLKILEKNWRNEGFLSREHEEAKLKQAKISLENFYKNEEKINYAPQYFEHTFNFMLEKTKITGRIDKVEIFENEIKITDFKTSIIEDQEKANKKTEESLQLFIYALAWKNIYGKIPNIISLHYLESDIIGISKITEKKLIKTEEKIKECIDGINSQNFSAIKNSFFCNTCAFNGFCSKN